MKILLFGDFVKSNSQRFGLSQNLKEFIAAHDHVVVNLEGPIIGDENNVFIKAGPHVRNDSDAIKDLREIGVDIALLANNHIMDYGVVGLRNTERILSEYCMKSVGIGDYLNCYKPLEIEECSIINICQLEFGGVKEEKDGIGFAWLRHEKVFETITEEKKRNKFCIVIPHAGLENETIPLPEIRKLYRQYIDCGADIVIGGHPHIIQGMEKWNDKSIYYSLGNMWFDSEVLCDVSEWDRSMFVSLDTASGECTHGFIHRTLDVLDFDDSEKTHIDFDDRCKILCDTEKYMTEVDIMVDRVWNEYYKKCYMMLPPFSSENIWGNIFNVLRSILRPKKRIFNETMLLHNLQIEPHLWCVERYLRNKNRSDNINNIK